MNAVNLTLHHINLCLQGPANADNLASHLKELPLASESLDSRGLYVYDDGLRFVIWLGKILSPEIANNLVGVDLSGFIDLSKVWFSLLQSAELSYLTMTHCS